MATVKKQAAKKVVKAKAPKEKKEKVVKADASTLEAVVYNQKGKESGKIKLAEEIFGLPWNADLVHQVVTSMQSSARQGTAHTKDRGEVRGGGKKPWKQKGTGRARHGSSRSPIWVGGGMTHGPRNEKNYTRKVNRKMKAKALYTLLSRKFKDGEMIFVDSITLSSIKTKLAKEVMGTLFDTASKKKTNAILLALPKKDATLEKSFRNFGNVEVIEARNLNPVALATYRYIAIVNPEESLATFSSKM
mgnify:CR=1 FL=1